MREISTNLEGIKNHSLLHSAGTVAVRGQSGIGVVDRFGNEIVISI